MDFHAHLTINIFKVVALIPPPPFKIQLVCYHLLPGLCQILKGDLIC